jgi:hypothetical protein
VEGCGSWRTEKHHRMNRPSEYCHIREVDTRSTRESGWEGGEWVVIGVLGYEPTRRGGGRWGEDVRYGCLFLPDPTLDDEARDAKLART